MHDTTHRSISQPLILVICHGLLRSIPVFSLVFVSVTVPLLLLSILFSGEFFHVFYASQIFFSRSLFKLAPLLRNASAPWRQTSRTLLHTLRRNTLLNASMMTKFEFAFPQFQHFMVFLDFSSKNLECLHSSSIFDRSMEAFQVFNIFCCSPLFFTISHIRSLSQMFFFRISRFFVSFRSQFHKMI